MEQEQKAFTSRMKGWQYALTLLYLPVHFFGLPLLFTSFYEQGKLSLGMANFWIYAVSAAFLLLLLWGFLRREMEPIFDHPFLSLLEIVRSYLLIWCAEIVAGLFLSFLGVAGDAANHEMTIALLQSERGPILAASVFVAPIAEECLFRGGLFGLLRHKNRALAYAVSALLFAVYHVWSAALADPSELIFLLEYIPAGLILARCYERTDSVWGSIFLHMLNNAVSIWAITGG